jgi:hypothetical protein
MLPETKIVLCSILALVIGIASVVPLAFFMYEESKKSRIDVEALFSDQSPLDFNLTYAYISGDLWNDNRSINNGDWGWKYDVNYRTVPNIDMNAFPISQRFVAFEYYTLEVSTGNEVVATLLFNSITYSRGSASYSASHNSTLFSFTNQQWLSFNSSNRMFSKANSQEGPVICGNGTAHGQVIGSASDWNISSGKPETIFLTVRRLGWVIIDNNSTTVHYASPEPLVRVQLQNYGDGFMYNKLFTENELAQINPVMPQFKFMR